MNPIITASLTGPAATSKQTPAMPRTPEEIAQSAKEAYEAGAAVIHIHLRDNDDFTTDLDVARRTVDLVREACPGIVQLSTGGGMAYEDRARIVEARPAMATLNPGTMTIGDFEFRNPPLKMYKLAERMVELGIKAEVEMYDTGHLGLTMDLLKKELLTEPLQVSFVMGVKGGMPADPRLLAYMVQRAAAGHQLAGHRHRQGQPAADHHRPGDGRQRAHRARGHAVHPAQGARLVQRPARAGARGRRQVAAPGAGRRRRGHRPAQAEPRPGRLTGGGAAMAEQDYVHMPTLEEYAERFARFFKFKRSDDGILEVRMHTFDGPVRWSYQMHHAFSELWTAVGHDTKNEVLIFTATGDQWISRRRRLVVQGRRAVGRRRPALQRADLRHAQGRRELRQRHRDPDDHAPSTAAASTGRWR